MTKNVLELLVDMYPAKRWWKGGMSENPLITMDLIEKLEKHPYPPRGGENEFDWKKLSKNSGITMETICDNIEKPWDFDYVSDNPNLTIEMIKKFPYKKWNWKKISENPAMTPDIIESNFDLPWVWREISWNSNLTSEFIEKYFRELTEQGFGHSYYYFCQKINLDIVEKNIEMNWNWRGISANSGLTINFIRKYRNYVNKNKPYLFWGDSDDTHRLSWYIISRNPVVTFEMMQENADLPWDYNGFSQNPNLKIDDVKNNMSYCWNWYTISGNKGISEEDIENNPNLPWVFSRIVDNPNVSVEFIEKYLDKIDSWSISKCSKLTFDFIKKYCDNNSVLDFSYLSMNPLTFENELLKEKSRVKSPEEILVLNIIKPYQDKIDELTHENKRLNALFSQFKNLINPIQTNKIKYESSVPKKRYTSSNQEDSISMGITTKRRDTIDDSTFRRVIPFEFKSKNKSIVYNVNSDSDDEMEMID
jgi:hypothetical protein